jgi:hypothetical protein
MVTPKTSAKHDRRSLRRRSLVGVHFECRNIVQQQQRSCRNNHTPNRVGLLVR